MKYTNKKILITGGASGIGLALAERFVRDGNTVIACGRRATALDDARSRIPTLVTTQCDLSTDAGREELSEWIADNHPDVQILINNAGIQQWMTPDDADYYERAKEEIDINVMAPLHLSTLLLKLGSLESVMNVTSGLAFVPLAKVPVYNATKAFLHSYTLSLRHLLGPKGIEVIEIIPPALNTDLGGKGIHDFAPPVDGFIESIFEQLNSGSVELTYGYTEAASAAGQDVLGPVFERMNNQ